MFDLTVHPTVASDTTMDTLCHRVSRYLSTRAIYRPQKPSFLDITPRYHVTADSVRFRSIFTRYQPLGTRVDTWCPHVLRYNLIRYKLHPTDYGRLYRAWYGKLTKTSLVPLLLVDPLSYRDELRRDGLTKQYTSSYHFGLNSYATESQSLVKRSNTRQHAGR